MLKGCPLNWSQLEAMASNTFWDARASLWDEHLSAITLATIERVTEETAQQVAQRQLALTRSMQRLATRELKALEKVAAENDFPGIITPRDALRLGMTGIRLERLIMGEATDRVETGPDLSKLSDDDLAAMADIQARAGIR